MTATCTNCPNGQTRGTAPPQKYDKKAIISRLTSKKRHKNFAINNLLPTFAHA